MTCWKRQGCFAAMAAMTLAATSCAPIGPSPGEEKPTSLPIATAPLPRASTPIARAGGLKERIERAIDQVRHRDLLTTNGFWTIFHGILGLGPSVTLLDPDTKQRVNALEYISTGNKVRGLEFIPSKDGIDVAFDERLRFVGQGHQDQFVAEMTQWGLSPDHRFLINGQNYTFKDFIHFTQMRVRVNAGQELDWAVMIIGNYLGTDFEWTNSFGEKLRFEDLLRSTLDAPIGKDKAACGGTHRLFGLDWVHHLHLKKGGKTVGIWKQLADNAMHYQQLAKQFQQSDGSFSTSFFDGPGNNPDMERRINTTGHTLEWLALSLPDAELKAAWVEQAVDALTRMIFDIQDKSMEGGSLYHAVHGLLIYYARVYDAKQLGANKPVVPLPPGQKPVD
jgi:hypothetical protein